MQFAPNFTKRRLLIIDHYLLDYLSLNWVKTNNQTTGLPYNKNQRQMRK